MIALFLFNTKQWLEQPLVIIIQCSGHNSLIISEEQLAPNPVRLLLQVTSDIFVAVRVCAIACIDFFTNQRGASDPKS